MPHFMIQALKAGELGEAWPLVRSSGCYANVDWWVTSAEEIIRRGGGVLAARAKDGRIHGVATFMVPGDITTDGVLTIPTLITFELSRGAPARSALLRALERTATKFGCTHLILPLTGKRAA
ncbi:MAG TPA: hypothetical protein VIV07_03450 [Sphingomicrobium sp.]